MADDTSRHEVSSVGKRAVACSSARYHGHEYGPCPTTPRSRTPLGHHRGVRRRMRHQYGHRQWDAERHQRRHIRRHKCGHVCERRARRLPAPRFPASPRLARRHRQAPLLGASHSLTRPTRSIPTSRWCSTADEPLFDLLYVGLYAQHHRQRRALPLRYQCANTAWKQSSTYPYDGGYQAPCGDPYCWSRVPSSPNFLSLEKVTNVGNGLVTYGIRLACPPGNPDCSNIVPGGGSGTWSSSGVSSRLCLCRR